MDSLTERIDNSENAFAVVIKQVPEPDSSLMRSLLEALEKMANLP